MKIKKKYFYGGVFLLLLLIVVVGFVLFSPFQKSAPEQALEKGISGYLDEEGLMLLPVRSQIQYDRTPHGRGEDYHVDKVVYTSAGQSIHGFLVHPDKEGEYPGVALLPGAGVGKDSELGLAIEIAKMGYVVLTIDQRGVGETKGEVLSFEEDYERYINGKVAIQHLFVLDALKAADLLTTLTNVDGSRIVIAGESLGGRIAIIAGAIDERIKGVLAISTSGFNFKGDPLNAKNKFYLSLDPDNYAHKIAPRKFVMIHNTHDEVISFERADITFAHAQKPKYFVLVNDSSCNHGYCESMLPAINVSLEYVAH